MGEEMSARESTKELTIDKELKEKFKNERNDEVERHIEAVKTWREKSLSCLIMR